MVAESDDVPSDEVSISLVEEKVTLRTEAREGARVRVVVRVAEEERLLDADLVSTTVEVERRPGGELLDEPPQLVEQDGVLIIPIVEETVVLQRKYRVVERVFVRRIATTQHVKVPVTLKKETAELHRDVSVDPSTPENPTSRTD